MNKYKFIILVVLSLFIGSNVLAAELTTEQKRFRTSLQEFLKEEGFMPTLDNEDNSLNFKKEGTLYWLSFGGATPIYIEFHLSGFKCEDADRDLVLQSVNSANRKVRCAKAMLNESSVSFAIEMYCHSPEEFKYVFYKCLSELDNVKNEVPEYYNVNKSDFIVTSASASSQISLIKKFFPIYDLTLGKTNLSTLTSLGYKVETDKDGDSHADVHGLSIWDFNEDKIIDFLKIDHNDTMPQKWDDLGLTWNLSYNQVISKLKSLGFIVEVKESPTTKKYSGRKTLSAKLRASSSDGNFYIDVTFNYGNSNGEGYSVNSNNTLYDLTFRVRK